MISIRISRRQVVSILTLIVIGGILRFYQINHFHFDFDQQVPAEAAYDFFINRKISLIGQELSFPGFFLGPLFNWSQFIPYGLCQLKPDCIPYFSASVSLLVLIATYFLLKNIYGSKVSTIAVGIFAISSWQILFDLNPNSNFFVLLSSVLILFTVNKYLSGDKKYFILGAFVSGLATVNFNPVFIFTTIAFFAVALLSLRKAGVFLFLLALVAFFVNYAPILIFNFRHENIIFNNMVQFINQNTTAGIAKNPLVLISQIISPFYSNFLFFDDHYIYGKLVEIFAIALLIIGVLKLNLRNKIEHSFLLVWIFFVTLGFLFYKGHIPEYYFIQILLPMVIIVATALRNNIYLFLAFVLIFVFSNVQDIKSIKSFVNYQAKKKIVDYIISDTNGETFNVIYEVPLGFKTGYDYLFKIHNSHPQEDGKNLYIIGVGEGAYTINRNYQQKFQTREVKELKIKENVHVVSVK